MLLTNHQELPVQVFGKILADINRKPYGDIPTDLPMFRVTELMGPPLPRSLKNKYWHTPDFSVDASFYMPMLFGTAVHKLLEGENSDTVLYEHRTVAKIDDIAYLAGTVDEYHPGTPMVIDNKTGMVFKAEKPVQEDYDWQVNIYAYLLGIARPTKNPMLYVRYFYKDWSAKRASFDYSYPPMIQTRAILPKNEDEIGEFIKTRMLDHLNNPFRPCTDEERNFGEGGTKYAVMVEGRKSALRVLDSVYEATELAQKQPPSKRAVVVERKDDSVCRLYCESKSVCPYAQEQGYCQ